MTMEVNVSDLLNQIKTLTENQTDLIATINAMKIRASDPFFKVTTPDPI